MKATLRTLIALLLLSAGLAWASGGLVTEISPATPVEVDQPQQSDETSQGDDQARAGDEQELSLEDLQTMDPDKVDVGACCWAQCLEEKAACREACGLSSPCLAQCQSQFEACKSNC